MWEGEIPCRYLGASVQAFDPDGHMVPGHLQRVGNLGAGEAARGLHPPQGEEFTLFGFQPAGRLDHFLPLTGQTQFQDGPLDEVRTRVGGVECVYRRADGW